MQETSGRRRRGKRPGPTAAAAAYAIIRDQILGGALQPGRRLKEEELTALCGVSRTPVREALRRLSVEGLVLMTPRQGAQVVTLDTSQLEEIYALRAMLEAHAASRAATRLQDTQILRLKELAARMEAANKEGRKAMDACFPEANAAFHAIILEAADSPHLVKMTRLVVQLPLTLRALANYTQADRTRSLLHHSELISAFEAKSPTWAASVMQAHVYAAFFALSRGPAVTAHTAAAT